jgi:hypothetical protein
MMGTNGHDDATQAIGAHETSCIKAGAKNATIGSIFIVAGVFNFNLDRKELMQRLSGGKFYWLGEGNLGIKHSDVHKLPSLL